MPPERESQCAEFPHVIIGSMGGLPLSTLLSQALVAFTIEFDNEAELRLPHRTTRHGSTPGAPHAPWLVSMAMYLNCMQFVDEKGMTARELVKRARAKTNFRGMHRWGYITVRPDSPEGRSKPKAEWIVRPTPAGCMAQEIWQPLLGEIEQRWRERFGKDEIERLKKSLATILSQIDLDLPDCLPILGYGLFSKGRTYRPKQGESQDDRKLPLPVLLARILLAFALEFEEDSQLSLAMSANVVRVLDGDGVPVRELSRLTGVSKEAVATSLSFLTKQGYAVEEKDPAGARAKVARLTANGLKAQYAYEKRLKKIEQHWRSQFGNAAINSLQDAFRPLVGTGKAADSPLFQGLDPDPNCWRASTPKSETLLHYPMVLHRGGFPDGS
jgi:DNA-binding MarR family transcriptional regulator